ncbi:MAG TPA: hypothetical protein PKX38_10155 [Alphaproteobacteria bacterium]|jgi:hypothetical protein|nr:hypothetical protein [Micavibrio sp.]MBK9563133.1 hypothetical protein [Micavibrio sp.]HQX28281.1 hypothetical protein [Alphaproteobacteria bacterium]
MNNQMMGPEDSNKKIGETLRIMTTLMNGLGIVMMAFGSFCLINIESVEGFMGYDVRTITIMLWIIIITGLGIVTVPIVEKFKMRKLK